MAEMLLRSRHVVRLASPAELMAEFTPEEDVTVR